MTDLNQIRAGGSGVVLGKFLPPHLGHKYLIDFARHYVDDLTVLVGSLLNEPIPGVLRHRWVSTMFPNVRVVHLTDENPQYPEEHEDFWEIWRHSILSRLPRPPDYLFASEHYGTKLASVLGATFVPVDIDRHIVPISGTELRNHPWRHWHYLPDIVRPYFAARVSIFGPTSTGKSTLSKALAKRHHTIHVPEYAHTHLELKAGTLEYADLNQIARGQLASAQALLLQANRVLFYDTDVLSTMLWSDMLFGTCAPWIKHEAATQHYDLTLLCDVDVPYVEHPVKDLPNTRQEFMDRCVKELTRHGRDFVTLTGSWSARKKRACEAVDALLATGSKAACL